MIIFYKTKSCQGCRTIEDMLHELCMTFEVVVSEGRDTLPQSLPANVKLPLLTDEGELFEGPENIINHLNFLQKFKEQWYKYQTDVCYCDENENLE